MFGRSKNRDALISADEALAGRPHAVTGLQPHLVLGNPLIPPFPDGHEVISFAMGCFWGTEKYFWDLDGVWTTAAGYQGGHTPNPTYEEVCTGRTGHAEAVIVVYDPGRASLDEMFKAFWENHDPTTPNRQGNDVGTQYRSAIYPTTDSQLVAALASRDVYQAKLDEGGFGMISTEIRQAGPFFYAEDYHQQYLFKNPNGYCNHGFCQAPYPAS
ncbi:MAG: peptide-methionine (S)-S-oxide reductase MsrA [Acidimicrobiia bacterium]